MIVSKDPELIMADLQLLYTVKSIGEPSYYLGNNFKKDKKGKWNFGCVKYLEEAISRVERIFGEFSKADTPSIIPQSADDHPETDSSDICDATQQRHFQMLIGILVWLVQLGRYDVAFVTNSLSRYVACPRVGHLDRALRVFQYLKRNKHRWVVVDSSDPDIFGSEEVLNADIASAMKEYAYPDATEELDLDLPDPLIAEILTTIFVDADHAHDLVTQRSCTGLLVCAGRTPIQGISKRQGAIETSTYGAEFNTMKTATEEAISLRYMLRCLGVHVTKPTLIVGDNRSVVLSCVFSKSESFKT